MVHKIKKILLIIVGTISMVLGAIGLFLPVLPTTPFLLLSSACYLKSSQRLYQWLMTRKVIGVYIFNYVTYKAVLKSTKVFSTIFLWITLAISMILVGNWHVRVFLIMVGIGVSIHLKMLKTIDRSDMVSPEMNIAKESEG